MAKKDNVEEVVTETVEETALAAPQDALSLLVDSMIAEESAVEQKFIVPRLSIYVSGKKYTDKGAGGNTFVIDKLTGQDDAVEVNISSLRLYRLDAPIMQRVMWPYGDDGKRLQGKDAGEPWCASSDGVTPRKGERFGYIGKEYVDWRTNHKVLIQENGCASCPLGDSAWKGVVDDSGQPVMEKDAKGVTRQRMAGPPCQETPSFVFYDFDRDVMLIYQAGAFSQRAHIMGARRSRWGALKGVNDFYFTDGGKKRPEVIDENNNIHALLFTVKQVDNSPYGYTPVAAFSVDPAPITNEELQRLAAAKQMYMDKNVRGLISGEFFSNDYFTADPTLSIAPVADAPF